MTAKFFQKLYGQLAATLFISFIFIGVFSTLLLLRSSRNYQQEISQVMHQHLAEHVAHNYTLFENGKPKLEAAEQTFHDLMILGPNFEFYLLDKNGSIVAYSTDPEKIKRKTVNITPIDKFIKTKKITNPICGDDPRSDSGIKIFSASPIYNNEELLGYLYVILGGEIYDDIASVVTQSKIIQWGLWLLAFGFVFSMLATLMLTGVITRPLRNLTKQIQSIRDSGFASIDLTKSDSIQSLNKWQSANANEIHRLGSAFKDLLEKLQEQYNTVITVDQLRKELLSHVSHDLRTPLASLLGYLETWELNRGKITDEESYNYIITAKKNAQKISNLVEQLFELAYLDSGNVQVNRERFSIAELAQDVLTKFKIIADEKHLSLNVIPKDSSIHVVGDIEKLERVLTNLVDNAIRHTKPGGTVVVRLAATGHSVAVEVTDTGIGIPEADIAHIFDPHFKAGNSVRGNTAHGGLGLAITKRLLDLHQSKISVTSKMAEGTTFEFSLQTGT